MQERNAGIYNNIAGLHGLRNGVKRRGEYRYGRGSPGGGRWARVTSVGANVTATVG